MLRENKLAKIAVPATLEVHTGLGPGLLESGSEMALTHLVMERGLIVERPKSTPLTFRGKVFIEGFKADLIVESLLLIELKSLEPLLPVPKKQTQTYVLLANLRLGLLINFNSAWIKNGILRLVHGLPDADNLRS